jgi:heptose I phosphotransferase
MMRAEQWQVSPGFEADFGPDSNRFDEMMRLQGEVFRDVPGRKTLRFSRNQDSYFVKLHFGIGWGEIFKNLLSLKWPILGAKTEWQAIARLNQIGIPTTPAVAFAQRGLNPARQESFLITEDLGDITSLETLFEAWKVNPPHPKFKRHLLIKVAELARKLHDAGMNHRDFYICHICLDNAKLAQGDIYLYLIDLHRVGMRASIKEPDQVKDMAALYFSAMGDVLSRRDFLRVLKHYRQKPLREIFKQEHVFWRRVTDRAVKLYVKFHGRMPEKVA